jgi:hypothetical protein
MNKNKGYDQFYESLQEKIEKRPKLVKESFTVEKGIGKHLNYVKMKSKKEKIQVTMKFSSNCWV